MVTIHTDGNAVVVDFGDMDCFDCLWRGAQFHPLRVQYRFR